MSENPSNPDYSTAISLIISNFNKKLQQYLPASHNPSYLYPDSSLYYQKLNSTYLRSESRVLLKHTESWPLSKVLNFFYFCMKEIPDRTFQMTVMFYMMYRYHEISEDLKNLDVFKNWILEGLFDKDSLTDFAEYCLLPLVNFKNEWILGMIDWANHENVNVRRAAALGIRKCGVDKDKAHIVVEVCSILLRNCEEYEIKTALGAVLRQVGKKKKGVLRVFLEENLKILPRKSLVDGVVRLSKKEQDYYLAEHSRLNKKKVNHESLVCMDLLEKSLNKQ